ncbi:MAG: hypothetical protein EOP06_00525 [Proteobacteria bacterium]|nr:MAG: hypothetical protein EOP06_00525 [Pseudomonadota bacterium]
MASTTVDHLITNYTLDDNYTPKTKNVVKSTLDVDGALSKAKSGVTGFMGVIGGLGSAATGAFQMVAGAATVVGGAVLGLAGIASKASADMDSLKRGLTAVAGSAEEADRQLKQLKEVAKLPGLGFKEAVQGAIALEAAGLSANTAMRALSGFGNALATVGRGKEDLEGVITALSQIISKGSVSAEEINQIAERVPQIRKLMQGAFGTSNTEDLQKMGLAPEAFIQGLLVELEKLPKVTGGAQNAFENLQDAVWQAFVAAGDVINTYLVPAISTVADFLIFMTESGMVTQVVEGFANLFDKGSSGSSLVRALSFVAALFKNLPKIVEGVGRLISDVFKVVGDNIQTVFTAAFSMFVTGTLFMGILRVIEVVRGLANAWSLVAAAESVTIGLTVAGLAVVAAAVAAGVGVYFGLNKLINDSKKDFGSFGAGNKYGIPTLDDINADATGIEAGFAAFKADQEKGNGTDAKKAAGQSMSVQQQIAKNTALTAKHTEESREDLKRYILGGGDLGAKGVSPIVMRRRTATIGGANKVADAVHEAMIEVVKSLGLYEMISVRR